MTSLFTKGSRIPRSPTHDQCADLLESFYFRSLEPGSNFMVLVNALMGSGQRSPEQEQWGPADSDSDLDAIAMHRTIRKALVKLESKTLYLLSQHYTDNQQAHPQLIHHLGEWRFLAPYTHHANLNNQDPKKHLQHLVTIATRDANAALALQLIREEAKELFRSAINDFRKALYDVLAEETQ